MHVTCCRLTLHENLFYATREIGRLYETGRYLHNYGLTYALGLAAAPYYNARAAPNYADDLASLNERAVYVTPARPQEISFELNTFKYADNRYRVKMEQSSRNTPSFGRAKEVAAGSTFTLAVLGVRPVAIPRWVRLGTWMSKAAVEVTGELAVQKQGQGLFESDWPLNPLDLDGESRVLAYDLISMPPVSLLDNVQLSGPYWQLTDGSRLPAHLAYRFPKA